MWSMGNSLGLKKVWDIVRMSDGSPMLIDLKIEECFVSVGLRCQCVCVCVDLMFAAQWRARQMTERTVCSVPVGYWPRIGVDTAPETALTRLLKTSKRS